MHPKTFAQLRAWDTTNDAVDAKYVRMMCAEEDWLHFLMIEFETLYYQFIRGTAAEET